MTNILKKKSFITDIGEKIYYFDSIDTKDSTILFIHDFMRSSAMFSKITKELLNYNRVVAFDLPGHGKNHKITSSTLEKSSEIINSLIKKLSLQNLSIISYGIGTLVLFQYIKDFGVCHLSNCMIIDSTPKYLNDNLWRNGLYRGNYTEKEFNYDKNYIANNSSKFLTVYLSQALPQYSCDVNFQDEPSLLFRFLGRLLYKKNAASLWNSIINSDFRSLLPTLTLPITIVYASPGSLLNEHAAFYMNNNLCNSTLHSINHTSHNSLCYKSNELINIINNFTSNNIIPIKA